MLLSWLPALLADAGIEAVVLDSYTSILEGSIGAIPRRLMVVEDDYADAARHPGRGRADGLSLAGGGGGRPRDDRLLDGRVRLRQPAQGYRAAIDPVLLAAASPADVRRTRRSISAAASGRRRSASRRACRDVPIVGLELRTRPRRRWRGENVARQRDGSPRRDRRRRLSRRLPSPSTASTA